MGCVYQIGRTRRRKAGQYRRRRNFTAFLRRLWFDERLQGTRVDDLITQFDSPLKRMA